MSFVRVCAVADVAKGEVVAAKIDDAEVAIVHADDDAFVAIHDVCSHADVPLSEGDVEDGTVECWLHGSRFDLRTGKPTGPPATEPVPVYPVEVRDGDIYVNLSEEK
jgi:3-phenylpropionate/trans-cinnamate dioxygenase ferredoxin subunit